MVLVFWQGIISIHQKNFLEAVSQHPSVSKVLLVVENDITRYRKNMGWDVPEINNVDIILSPTKDEIYRVIKEYTGAVHIMGGIRAGQMISTAFLACVKSHCRLGIMTEPYNHEGPKGWLRTIKYKYYRARYSRYIQFILTIGGQGMRQFTHLGFGREKLFPWAYFISLDTGIRKSKIPDGGKKRIVYVGRLEKGKGIYRFTEELANLQAKNYSFDIYGEGPDEERLKQLVVAKGLSGQINFYGFLKHDELLKKYLNYDWVVLPSSGKDGWGVIVSEGLLSGLKALCSSICGASGVIKDGFNGAVFEWAKEGSCKKAIETMLEDYNFALPGVISSWANDSISGDAGAGYFMKIVDCVYEGKQTPQAPWEHI